MNKLIAYLALLNSLIGFTVGAVLVIYPSASTFNPVAVFGVVISVFSIFVFAEGIHALRKRDR